MTALRSFLVIAAIALTGCGQAPLIGSATPESRPSGLLSQASAAAKSSVAKANDRQGSLLYGAFIRGTVTKVTVIPGSPSAEDPRSHTRLTVEVKGPQPQPHQDYHGKLIFDFNGKGYKTIKAGDRVEGFVSYVTVDLDTKTFINDSTHLTPMTWELKITPQ